MVSNGSNGLNGLHGLGGNVGVDLGYGFLKVTDGAQDHVFPSVVGMGQELTYHSELTLYTGAEDNLVVELDGERFFVGSLAVRQSEIASRSLAEDRPADRNARVLFATALGLLTAGPVHTFNVVTGLPPAYFRPYRDALVRLVQGDHRVTFIGRERREERAFTVENVRVVPQPFGTLYELFLDRTGNVQNTDLASARVGVVDVGFRTADFVVSDHLEYTERLSHSTTSGLAAAYGLLTQSLQREFGLRRENYELDELVQTGRLRLAGKVHDIAPLREAAFRQVAEKIVTEINSLWSKDDLDVIYLTGGGGQALSGHLLGEFPNAVLVPGAQAANVRGYWKLAQKLFSRWSPRSLETGEAIVQR